MEVIPFLQATCFHQTLIGHPEIYVMGCRNPEVVSTSGQILYWGDVGPDAGQDGPRPTAMTKSIARQAGNYGWPYFIANNQAYFQYDLDTKEIGPAFDPDARQ